MSGQIFRGGQRAGGTWHLSGGNLILVVVVGVIAVSRSRWG